MLASSRRLVYYSRVRRLLSLSLLAMAACSERGPAGESVAAFAAAYGQDPIALRVARGGGPVRAYQYPRLDSLIWTSTQSVGPQPRVQAFDPENGLVAFVDRSGVPGWVDLRVGSVKPSRTPKLDHLTSTDASSIFGVTRDTLVHRSTPSGEWQFSTSDPVSRLIPTSDGGLIIMTSNESSSKLVRLRPPERTIMDSVIIGLPNYTAMSPLGDRLYLAFGSDVAAFNVSTFDEVARVRFDGPVSSLVTTPSGDRVFVATERSRDVAILDRYSGERTESVTLPSEVGELRMDPLGRLLLARPDTGDSVWVINIGTNRVVATLPTAWRADLPTIAHDGTVATVVGRDVNFTTPGAPKPRIIIRDGANETWYFVFWNGFRPRASVLDEPVVFPVDTTYYVEPASDSAFAPTAPLPVDTATTRRPQVIAADTTDRVPPTRSGWSVQVAAVLSEERAREIARTIRVDGASPRVTMSEVDGSRVYRVVMGPFPTRADADRVGRQSGRDYWVFEGVP